MQFGVGSTSPLLEPQPGNPSQNKKTKTGLYPCRPRPRKPTSQLLGDLIPHDPHLSKMLSCPVAGFPLPRGQSETSRPRPKDKEMWKECLDFGKKEGPQFWDVGPFGFPSKQRMSQKKTPKMDFGPFRFPCNRKQGTDWRRALERVQEVDVELTLYPGCLQNHDPSQTLNGSPHVKRFAISTQDAICKPTKWLMCVYIYICIDAAFFEGGVPPLFWRSWCESEAEKESPALLLIPFI